MRVAQIRTPIALVLALIVPPLFVLTIWLNGGGPVTGSLQACVPNQPWLGELALMLWAVALVTSMTICVAAIVGNRRWERAEGIGILALLGGMAPFLLFVSFFMVYGDPGPTGAYLCPF